MIFRSAVHAMVVATAAAALISLPTYTTTTAHSELLIGIDESMTTAKPADNLTTSKPADTIATIKPAVNTTTVKPAAPVPTQAPMISCYCNLPECSVAAGGVGTCSTRLGCYSEVQPIIPGIEEEIVTPAPTKSNNTANGSAVSPIIPEFEQSPAAATTEHASVIRGSFGCLDQLNFAKQSCDEILKSMEAESSEFPIIQVPTNGAAPSAMNDGVHAFHCCQTERCNGNQSGPAEGSVKSAQAVLVAELKNTVESNAIHDGGQNSTVGVPWTPTVFSSVNSSINSSVSNSDLYNSKPMIKNVEFFANTKKLNTASSTLWDAYFGINALSEPKAPSALQSDNSSEGASFIEATSPAIPAAVPATLPVAVPDKQEITHDDTVGHVEHEVNETVSHVGHVVDETVSHVGHVVMKRSDQPKAVPVLKQTVDEQENISDFDDDIAAEVAAAVATAKTPLQLSQEEKASLSDQWGPRHSGVPDFLPPPPVLKKNFTTKLFSPVEGVNNHSNHYNIHAVNNDSDVNNSVIGLICAIALLGVLGLSLLMMFVLRNIIRNTDVFKNYKGVCSNPGQPCACRGGFSRPSSSHPEAAAAAVNRNASCSTAPLLPPPNPGHRSRRGHANPGAMYNDSTGDATYVFTPIPAVSDNVAPVRVVRR
ncbi:uncharacterized protein LOC111037741 [Myzus persicae]|uniref:uncharacterized protein LOC111037741 n=1 Tax=Myzus persicae TaxID=13164 RepID=UPI000B92FE8B|nr:uncharacterized protein LOC111037741 [Myzus persicae]